MKYGKENLPFKWNFLLTRYLPIAFTLKTMLAKIWSRFGKFFEKTNMFIWTRRMQFWQPCWKFFAKRQKRFRSKSENDKKYNSKKF